MEDIGIFWDLPNFDEQKYYYFQAVDLDPTANDFQKNSGVQVMSQDELVEDHYEWKWNERTHNLLEKGFGAAAVSGLAFAYLAL